MASPNVTQMQIAIHKASDCMGLVKLFEKGSFTAGGRDYPFSPAQITLIKQDFVAARNECKAAIDAVVA